MYTICIYIVVNQRPRSIHSERFDANDIREAKDIAERIKDHFYQQNPELTKVHAYAGVTTRFSV